MPTRDISAIEEAIGHSFTNKDLLQTALTHRSFLNENREEPVSSNERLEFLGDAVLQFLTSEFIYHDYVDFPEGELTNLRSKLVNTESLSQESTRLEYGKFLRISKGEKETAQTSSYILADAFEAVLGALYLDQGLEVCRTFLAKHLFYKAKDIVDNGQLKDAKSLYQEITQEKYGITPAYKVLTEEGPDHDKVFTVGAYLHETLVATGNGPSKRAAERNAAEQAIDKEKSKN